MLHFVACCPCVELAGGRAGLPLRACVHSGWRCTQRVPVLLSSLRRDVVLCVSVCCSVLLWHSSAAGSACCRPAGVTSIRHLQGHVWLVGQNSIEFIRRNSTAALYFAPAPCRLIRVAQRDVAQKCSWPLSLCNAGRLLTVRAYARLTARMPGGWGLTRVAPGGTLHVEVRAASTAASTSGTAGSARGGGVSAVHHQPGLGQETEGCGTCPLTTRASSAGAHKAYSTMRHA
jgi:hypothetical protein